MGKTNIEWAEVVWNPVRGCSRTSPGCGGATWTGKLALIPETLELPMRWRKPRRVFVHSMSDLFRENLPDEAIDRVFAIMALTPQHEYLVLTKRSDRMLEYMTGDRDGATTADLIHDMQYRPGRYFGFVNDPTRHLKKPHIIQRWPLPNVMLGVSVEDQQRADERISNLLATPAARRFLSCEPLLSEVDLTHLYHAETLTDCLEGMSESNVVDAGDRYIAINPKYTRHAKIDLVIVGGESGPRRRPVDPAWMRSIRDQCASAGVPLFVKQIDKVMPIPDDLMIRQWPPQIAA